MNRRVLIVLYLCRALGCASQKAPPSSMLCASIGSPTDMAAKPEEGNRVFTTRHYAGAGQSYRHTIAACPNLVEAHYNIAGILDRMGNQGEARKH